jgi:hypothetical protein
MLRTIDHVNLAHRAAIDVPRAFPAVLRRIIHNHQPCLAQSNSRRARAEATIVDIDGSGALSNSLQGV